MLLKLLLEIFNNYCLKVIGSWTLFVAFIALVLVELSVVALLKFHIYLGTNQTEKNAIVRQLRTIKISVWEVIFNYLLPRQACRTNLITCIRQASGLHLKSCVHRMTCVSGPRLNRGKNIKMQVFSCTSPQSSCALYLPGEANAFGVCPAVMMEKPKEKFS